jgi:hypothetical protein
MWEGTKQVRRVIQHKRTGHFLTVAGGWTADVEQANHLPNVLAAVRLARELELQDVDLVLKFQDGKYDVRLDL